jgi:hypothetical protein
MYSINYIIMDDSTWRNKEQGINNSYYLNPMLFLNKHEKSVFFHRNCKYVQRYTLSKFVRLGLDV